MWYIMCQVQANYTYMYLYIYENKNGLVKRQFKDWLLKKTKHAAKRAFWSLNPYSVATNDPANGL